MENCWSWQQDRMLKIDKNAVDSNETFTYTGLVPIFYISVLRIQSCIMITQNVWNVNFPYRGLYCSTLPRRILGPRNPLSRFRHWLAALAVRALSHVYNTQPNGYSIQQIKRADKLRLTCSLCLTKIQNLDPKGILDVLLFTQYMYTFLNTQHNFTNSHDHEVLEDK